jgi:hypothetical protein
MLKYMRRTAGGSRARAAGPPRAALMAMPCLAAALALAGCTTSGEGRPDLACGAARTVGWAAGDLPEAKDFVRATRPTGDLAWIPVGRAGLERPVRARDAGGVNTLEAALREERDRNVAQARRPLPRGAYGTPLPSVAVPDQGTPAAAGGQPATFPVNQNRLRQMRENSQRARQSE